MKGFICVPHTGLFPYQFVASFTEMVCYTRTFCEDLNFKLIGSCLVYEAREMCAEAMIEGDYDWLLFLDSDMAPRPDLIQRLLAHDKDIVSAMAFKRVPPYSPCFYPKVDYIPAGEVGGPAVKLFQADDWTKGLGEIEGVGMACTLIRKGVFEKVPAPRFMPMPVLAEDLGFCLRARRAGFKIYVDTTQVVPHVATEEITDVHFRMYKEAQSKLLPPSLEIMGAKNE